MKQIIKTAVITVFSVIFSFNVFAAGTAGFSLSVSQQEEENAVISVNVSENSGLYTTEFFICFDTEKLEYIKGSERAGAACDGLSPYITANETEEGRLKVSYTCTKPLENGGEMIILEFESKQDAVNEIELEIEHAETFDGADIIPLEFEAAGTKATLQETAKPLQTALALAVPVAAAIIIAVGIKIKKK